MLEVISLDLAAQDPALFGISPGYWEEGVPGTPNPWRPDDPHPRISVGYTMHPAHSSTFARA